MFSLVPGESPQTNRATEGLGGHWYIGPQGQGKYLVLRQSEFLIPRQSKYLLLILYWVEIVAN